MESNGKILIADDDPRNIFALRLTLQARGFECICVSGARDAISAASASPESIGLILMDMMMPDMDGYEAIASLRTNPRTASLPIVAVTAQAMPGDREKCLAAGANAYVSKPVNVDLLFNILDDHLK